jgi:hypothetical protein
MRNDPPSTGGIDIKADQEQVQLTATEEKKGCLKKLNVLKEGSIEDMASDKVENWKDELRSCCSSHRLWCTT